MAGPDERDRYSLPAPAGDSFLAACDAGIAGLSVAWSADLGRARVDPVVSDALRGRRRATSTRSAATSRW